MRIKETKVYPFSELSDTAKEKAIEQCADFNVEYDWWGQTYEDAKQVGLKLTEFELDRRSYCRGEFIESAEDIARTILAEHGKHCETHKTATEFIASSAELNERFPEKLDDDGYDENETDREDEQESLDDWFLYSILGNYRIMLQENYEYLISAEAIIETIETNEYEFTADGVLA